MITSRQFLDQIINDRSMSDSIVYDEKEDCYCITNNNINSFIELSSFIKQPDSNAKIIVNDHVCFEKIHLQGHLNFSNCIFNENVTFEKVRFTGSVSFENCHFRKNTKFLNSTFESKVRFNNSVFDTSINFQNTVFNDLADFYKCRFKENQQFFLTDFLNITIFSNVIFEKQIQFYYNKVSSSTVISFESSEFKESLDISRANFWCKLHFWNVIFEFPPNNFSLYNDDDLLSDTNEATLISLKKIRESCRIIKNEFISEGNIIESLQFQKFEMMVYEKELKNKKISQEYIILLLNKASNNFGSNWLRGVIFTFSTTLIFYLMALLAYSSRLKFDFTGDSILLTIKHYFEFLNITKWDIKLFNIDSTTNISVLYILLFIGRIFIGYGYYQTIQAFRKHIKR